jgi:lipopolysaccharide transport system ATP-binding protein
MKPAISVQNLSKRYQIGTRHKRGKQNLTETLTHGLKRIWRGVSTPRANAPADDGVLWALKDVSFDVKPGEVVGVIGRNGAGKSTLLKILSQTVEPTAGRVEYRGRISSLLEVGTGFHPELTGRENVYLNGSILGMSRREIDRKFDAIVAFSEIERFIETPVKRYSSGMYVRLAFAVAAHLDADILIVDEVLSVGDAAFQQKCMAKIESVSRSGRTVLFVSHGMAEVLHLCDRVVLLKGGAVSYVGDAGKGVQQYAGESVTVKHTRHGGELDLSKHPNRRDGCLPYLQKVRLLDREGRPTERLVSGEAMKVELLLESRYGSLDMDIFIQFEDAFGGKLFVLGPYLSEGQRPGLLHDSSRAVCELARLPLIPGQYGLSFEAGPFGSPTAVDALDQAIYFNVVAKDPDTAGRMPPAEFGAFLAPSRWTAYQRRRLDGGGPGESAGPEKGRGGDLDESVEPPRERMGKGIEPFSYLWGDDRGLSLFQYYVEQFVREFASDIRGHCLEFHSDYFTTRLGGAAVTKLDIMQGNDPSPFATVVADLTKPNDVPDGQFDCIICSHQLNGIAQLGKVVSEFYRILKPGGSLLVAVPHVAMHAPGCDDLWRFSPQGLRQVLGEAFGADNVTVRAYGNSLTAAGQIRGLVAQEFTPAELDHHDQRFAVDVCGRAVKKAHQAAPAGDAGPPLGSGTGGPPSAASG